jgi:hypothetical protein
MPGPGQIVSMASHIAAEQREVNGKIRHAVFQNIELNCGVAHVARVVLTGIVEQRR